MRIDRRELLRQFGATAAASVLLPSVVEPASASAEGTDIVAKLDSNENAYGPSEKAKEALHQAVGAVNRYPAKEIEKLCEAIAGAHGVESKNITLGCGSTELLRMAADACLGPGQNIVMATRTFSKVYGLAGLRVGYAVSSEETAKRLKARRLPGSINVVAARVAFGALADTAHVKKIAHLNSNDRQEFFNQANARMLRCLDS